MSSIVSRLCTVLILATSGCQGCREHHPYVPYEIGPGQPAASVPPGDLPAGARSAVATGDARSPFQSTPATVAPSGLSQWVLDDIVLQAPRGRVFVSALARDFDGDGKNDAFALARPADGNDPGELLYYRGQLAADTPSEPTVFAPPAGLARDSTCVPINRLIGIGERTVLAELGATCANQATSAPDRWVAVVRGGAEASVRLAATISDPPGAASLSVDGDASDRDGDGLVDISLRVSIEGGGAPLEPGPRVAAVFAWLDRTAGLSRDLAATESSFASLAATATARASRVKDAPSVPGLVTQVRALWRCACTDGGAPRIVGVTGTGNISCGASRALESVGLAEVRAYVTIGDALRASLAFDRAEQPPATHSASRVSEAERWIARLAPVANARAMRAVAAVPAMSGGHEPAWGSLAFDTGGKLLVRTRAGLVRVDPDDGDEAAADAANDWKTAVTSPDGAMRWIETYDPCDGLPLRATLALTSGDDLREVALPVLPPLGDRCIGSRGAPARALPIAWGPAGLEAIVEGEPVLISSDLARATPLASFLGQPRNLGSPRSPDGRVLVVPTGAGLLVRDATRARLLRAQGLDGTYSEQRDCTVSNDAAHIACVRAGRAWVGVWDAS